MKNNMQSEIIPVVTIGLRLKTKTEFVWSPQTALEILDKVKRSLSSQGDRYRRRFIAQECTSNPYVCVIYTLE